jgi:hypothetical protein
MRGNLWLWDPEQRRKVGPFTDAQLPAVAVAMVRLVRQRRQLRQLQMLREVAMVELMDELEAEARWPALAAK